jgi:hypothetical protein
MHMKISLQQGLTAYSVTLTTVLAVLLLTGATKGPAKATFAEIDVERINMRESDGTLRLVISNTGRFPGIIFRGKEHAHPSGRKSAGLLFFNDEGTENGGLIFGGKRQDGKAGSYGHLSFDQYEQDQVITFSQRERDGVRTAGLGISDRPDEPLDFELDKRLSGLSEAERRAEIDRLASAGKFGRSRLFVGKSEQAARVELKDAQGRPRLALEVAAEGTARIQFLDEAGKVVRSITP